MIYPTLHDVQSLRDFVKLKKIQQSEKNSEVGGWVQPQLKFCFLGCFL